MRKIILTSVVVLAIMGLVGCANVGAKFNASEIKTAPDNAALVYFYRVYWLPGSNLTRPVIANDVEIGTLDSGAYFKQFMPPGVYKIHSDTGAIDRIATIAFEAGKTYFVRCFLDRGFWVNSIRFVVVHEDEALPEIKETALQLYD
jgi:hypothetical protein